jgi:hypothetical protein
MGVKASRLILVDMLKGLCGGGLDVPMAETDIFDKNGKIVDKKIRQFFDAGRR